MADHSTSTSHSAGGKPKFSAGLVTGIVTLAWLVVFGLVVLHGIDGINQHNHVVSQSK